MAPNNPQPHPEIPGEAGVETRGEPPFVAEDEQTRWLFSLNRMGIRPGLQRIRSLLAELGHPERSFRTLVVAGTNGKGTATRALATLLGAAGHRTACYTSPHLLRVYERLAIDDAPVDPDIFAETVARVRPLTERYEASWFETLTAVSLEVCRLSGVEVLCCETGLGGRLDASNALPAEAVLLTGVSLDHTHILGGTRQEILAEKLGLLKPGVPLFAALPDELRGQAFTAAVSAGSPCVFLDEMARIDDHGETWDLATRDLVVSGLPALPSPPLRRSVALSVLALSELSRDGGFGLPEDPAAALADLFLPGRFQKVLTGPDWYFDTAHNDEALGGALSAFLSGPVEGRRVVLFGGMQDKQLGPAVGGALAAADLVVAAPVSLLRSRNSADLGELLREWRIDAGAEVLIASGVGEALAALSSQLDPRDSVLVTGSCFIVAEVLYKLGFRDLEQTRGLRPAGPVLAAAGGRADDVPGGAE